MRKMKFLAVVICALGISTFATGCGQVKGTCEGCRQNKPLYELTVKASLAGVTDKASHELCEDCAEATIDEIKKQAKNYDVEIDYTLKKVKK